jgi:GT2 family glycosyltransferase
MCFKGEAMEFLDQKTVKIAFIILTWNQREKTIKCLSNLREIKKPSFHIVLWDNGSRDGTVEAVREAFPEVLAHHHSDNLGVAPGRNAAAEFAIKKLNPTHLLFLDNDMRVEPNFVDALLKPFIDDKTIGQTQAKLRFMSDPQRLNDGGGCRISFWLGRTVPIGYGELDRGQYDTPKQCVACGGAMMVRADVFQQLGGFDTGFGVLGPDDLDFSLRLRKAGYNVLYVPQAIAYHEVSHTYGRDYNQKYARLKTRNWFVFMRRHASLIEQIGFVFVGAPYRILRMIIREGRKGNLAALRGVLRGLIDFCKPKPQPEQ